MGERMFIMNIERTEISKALEEKDYNLFIKAYRPMVNHLFREFQYSPKLVKMMFGFPSDESLKLIKEMPTEVRSNFMYRSSVFDMKEKRTNETKLDSSAMTYIEVKENRIKKTYLDSADTDEDQAEVKEEKIDRRGKHSRTGKYENVPCDYSRLYPSDTCKEFSMRESSQSVRVKTYMELIDKLKYEMSANDIAAILNVSYWMISDVFKRLKADTRYPRIKSMIDSWKYSEGQYALPANIADMIDEFEERTFSTKTPVVKEDYRTVKKINTEEAPVTTPDVEEKVYDAEPAVYSNDNAVSNATHHVIVPDNYLDDEAYSVLCTYFDIIANKYMMPDIKVKPISVKEVMYFTMRVCKLENEQRERLRSIIIPIERTCGVVESEKISEFI